MITLSCMVFHKARQDGVTRHFETIIHQKLLHKFNLSYLSPVVLAGETVGVVFHEVDAIPTASKYWPQLRKINHGPHTLIISCQTHVGADPFMPVWRWQYPRIFNKHCINKINKLSVITKFSFKPEILLWVMWENKTDLLFWTQTENDNCTAETPTKTHLFICSLAGNSHSFHSLNYKFTNSNVNSCTR